MTPGLCGLHAGAREAFLEQVTGLEGAVKAAREQLWALSSARCAQAQAEKTCIQLAELDAALESSEEEIVQAAIILKSLVPQGPLLTTRLGLPWQLIWWPLVCLFGEAQFPHPQNGCHAVPLVLTQWDHVRIDKGTFQVDSECPLNEDWAALLPLPRSGALLAGC